MIHRLYTSFQHLSVFRVPIALLCILFLASILRLHNLSITPTGIHGDEASIGWNAYSLMKTGYTESGQYLPLSIDQFGDYRPPGYHYLAIPFVAVLGLNEFSTRLPSAVFGIASVLAMFFLAKAIFNHTGMGIVSALMLAVSPWHIVISRSTSEGVIAAWFVLVGAYCFIAGIKQQKASLLLASAFLFIASFFFYHAPRLFVPLLIVPLAFSLFFSNEKKVSPYVVLLSSIVILFVFVGSLFIFSITSGEKRAGMVSIFSHPLAQNDIKQQIGEDGTNHPLMTRFFHNKAYYFGRLFLQNYFPHYSGTFWFVENGLPIRYRVPWTGTMHYIDGIAFLFGCSFLISGLFHKKSLFLAIPLIWFALGGVPAGLTTEDIPNIQRSSLLLYGFIMIAAYGIIQLVEKGKTIRWAIGGIYGIFLFIGVLHFNHNYFHHEKVHEPWHRSWAVKELNTVLQDLKKEYRYIIMTTANNNNLIHYLFYNRFSPEKYKELGFPRERNGLVFDGIYFSYEDCPIGVRIEDGEESLKDTVFVTKSGCRYPEKSRVLRTVFNSDGTPAYDVVQLQ